MASSFLSLQAGNRGASVWRWELDVAAGNATEQMLPGVRSQQKLSAPLSALPQGELLLRGDSVAFPAGGCAYLHRHQGPGIRCLIEGGIRIDTQGTFYILWSRRCMVRERARARVCAGIVQSIMSLHPSDDPAAEPAGQELDRIRQ